MNRIGHHQIGTCLQFVEDLPFEVGRPVDISQPMPEIAVGKQSREWFWRRRVLRVRLDKLRDGTKKIGLEFQYHEALQNGSFNIFPEHANAEANPEAR